MIKSIWQNKGLTDLSIGIFFGFCVLHINCLDSIDKLSAYIAWGIIVIAYASMFIQVRRASLAKKINNFIYSDVQRVVAKKEDCKIQKKDRGKYTVRCTISYKHQVDERVYELSDDFEIDIKNEKKFNEALYMQSDVEFIYSKTNPSYNMMCKSVKLKEIDRKEKIWGWRKDKIALAWFVADILYTIYIISVISEVRLL